MLRRAHQRANLGLRRAHRRLVVQGRLRAVLEVVPDNDVDSVPRAQVEEVRVPVRVLERVDAQRVDAGGGDERDVALVDARVLAGEEVAVRLEPVGIPAHRHGRVTQRAHQPRLTVQVERAPEPAQPPRVRGVVQRGRVEELAHHLLLTAPGPILRLRVHERGVVPQRGGGGIDLRPVILRAGVGILSRRRVDVAPLPPGAPLAALAGGYVLAQTWKLRA